MIFNNESEFQLAVNQDLRDMGIPFMHRLSSKGGKARTMNHFTIDGVKMAWLDNTIFLKDRCIHIELKHGKGKCTLEQDSFIYHFNDDLNQTCYVIYNWDEWERLKKYEGISA